jgi:UDP:flavonoid glycosyltransferase YjiC (YdhE family)
MTDCKPVVLMLSTPLVNYHMPIRIIAEELISRGYDVAFVSSSAYKVEIEAIGARFFALEDNGRYAQAASIDWASDRDLIAPGPAQHAHDMEQSILNYIPGQHGAQQTALEFLHYERPGRPIVVLYEVTYLGILPTLLDAPDIKPTASIGIGIGPIALSSVDTSPFGFGLPPESSLEGRIRNSEMNQVAQDAFDTSRVRCEEILRELGVTKASPMFLDAIYLLPSRFMQMCIPSVEYPRSDAPSTIHFAGRVPSRVRDPSVKLPNWWQEIVENKTKKIVAVSQRSTNDDISKLIIPAMNGLKDYRGIIVIVDLGHIRATIPNHIIIPNNVRVLDFIPFDLLLPHCAIFIMNGDYDAFLSSIANGVPLVIGGATEGRCEVAARAAWAGVGVNLETENPSAEEVAAGVKRVIENDGYKARSRLLQEEMKQYNSIDEIQKSLDELAINGNHYKSR